MPSVDCVLDPSKCGASKPKLDKHDPVGDPRGVLPDKLSSAQLRNGLAAIKPAARKCGRNHGIPSGESIKVKLSLIGKSGRIESVSILDDYAGTPVATCVAKALKTAEFPSFAKSRMGALYTLRM